MKYVLVAVAFKSMCVWAVGRQDCHRHGWAYSLYNNLRNVIFDKTRGLSPGKQYVFETTWDMGPHGPIGLQHIRAASVVPSSNHV